MHPHKLKEKLKYRGNANNLASTNEELKKDYWADFEKEMSGRLSTMAKRNVTYTAVIETPVRKSKLGVPENVNMATIEDHEDTLYGISGETKNQEVHDGSSFINYAYSLMLDNSFPAKGYSGTKKQFATFITDFGVTIKKDAESIITNDKIMNSKNSSIKFYEKQKQMLSLPIGDINFKYDKDFDNEFFFNELGNIYRIDKVIIENGKYKMLTSLKGEDQ